MMVLVDCDGVLFDTHVYWAERYRELVRDDKFLSLGDIVDWNFLPDLLKEKFYSDYLTPVAMRDAPIDAAMCAVVDRIMDVHDVTFVSDIRDKRSRSVRKSRLMRVFDMTDERIQFIGIERADIDADVLIDDCYQNCVSFVNSAPHKQSILMAKPWNCNSDLAGLKIRRAWGAHDAQLIFEGVIGVGRES